MRIMAKILQWPERYSTSKELPHFSPPDDQPRDSLRFDGGVRAVTDIVGSDTPCDLSFASSGSFDVSEFSLSAFGKLLDAMPIPAMLIDHLCSIVFANESCARLGANSHKMSGTSFLSLLPAERHVLRVRDLTRNVFIHKKPQFGQALLKTDRLKFWCRMHFRSLRLGNNQLILVLVEDLTAEKKQLIVTKRREQQLRQIRDELEERVDCRTAELTAINEQLQKEVAHRVQAQSDLRLALNELERRVEERTRELVTTNQKLKQQIIARRGVQVALRESEEKYRAIVENIEEGYYEADIAGNFTFLNDWACSVLACEKHEFLGRNYRALVDEHHEERMRQVFFQVLSTGKSVRTCQCRLTAKDGVKRDVEISVALIPDSTGQPKGFRGCFRDITETKRLHEEQGRVEKLSALGVLAGGIAHDFNNMLTALQGNIALARALATSDGRVSRLLTEAEKASVRAQALTRQLLTFSKGGVPIKKAVSTHELARACCDFALRGSNVRCEFAFPDSLWAVEADEGQLGQVFSNLIINANQAMQKGGAIRVRGENMVLENGHGLPLPDGKYVRIAFIDQGCGIPPENLEKIFDPYFTSKSNGSGLGLAISYSIIKNHDGLISVDSEPDIGTTFSVYLPASESEIQGQREPDDALVEGQGKVLIMDDEEAIRQLGQELLSMLGYEVELAQDGAEAIGMCLKARECGRPFDVVIMDLTVPGGMGGCEAIQMLRRIDPTIKAIVSSGYSDDPVMAQYKEVGFNGIVTKPYTYKELTSELHRVISGETS